MQKELPTGFFKQELKEGDHIVMMCRSYGSHYMRECHIHAIEYFEASRPVLDPNGTGYLKDHNGHYVREKYLRPKVKISYPYEAKKWVYDRATGKGHYENLGTKKKISRVYNWCTAITI